MVKPGTSRARLVAHLLLNGPRHRAELARALSISRGTTTTIVQQLLQEGILVDGVDGVDGSGPATHDGPATSDRAASGRPDRSSRPAGEGTSGGGGVPGPAGPTGRTRLKQKLGISHRRGVFAHVTFQATASIVAITALDGRVLAHDVRERPSLPRAADWLEVAHAQFHEQLGQLDLSADAVVHLHAAVNSQVDRLTGELLDAEVAGPWKGTQPHRELAAWVPRAGLSFENTARLLTLAESLVLGRQEGSLLRLELSWGIGMGQVFNGQIVTGVHGASGELGHVSIDAAGPLCGCGRRGCLWLYAGAGKVIDRVRTVLGPTAELPELARAAAEGNSTCRRELSKAGDAVGEALATVCNLLGPDVVAIGGELSVLGEPLLNAIRQRLMQQVLPLTARHLELLLSRVGDDPVPIISAAHTSLLNDEDVVASALHRALGLPATDPRA